MQMQRCLQQTILIGSLFTVVKFWEFATQMTAAMPLGLIPCHACSVLGMRMAHFIERRMYLINGSKVWDASMAGSDTCMIYVFIYQDRVG